MMLPCASTSTLPKMSSGQAMRPKSGGFLKSLRWTQPPTPPPPGPPCPLAPSESVAGVSFALDERLADANPPPDWKVAPPGDARAFAWLIKPASLAACSASTEFRILRKPGLAEKDRGVGGSAVVVPMAREGDGGSVRR